MMFTPTKTTKKAIALVSKRNQNQNRLYRDLQTKYDHVTHSEDLSIIDNIRDYNLIIFWSANDDKISKEDIDAMKAFLNEGKSVAFFGCFGGGEMVNDFLSDYGMKFQNNGVIRTSYSKYLHPKHALIPDGVVHTGLCERGSLDVSRAAVTNDMNSIDFVYPSGCTIHVQPPSWPLLSTGTFCFPLKRPICGVWEDTSRKEDRGRLLALGSSEMFSNEWFDKESNGFILDRFFQFLLQDGNHSLPRSKTLKENIEDSRTVPDIEALAGRLKWCLHEHPPLPQDLTTLFFRDMLTFDTSMIPKVMDLYEELNVQYEQLTLILPQLERPSPPLQPAVFEPKLIELPPPSLDQFDLDEEFANPTARLAQLTNKCTGSCTIGDDDLEYFIQEAGCVANLIGQNDELGPKAILYRLFRKVVAIRSEGSKCDVDLMEETPINIEIKRM